MIVGLVVLDGIKDTIKAIDDFISEHVFLYLYLFCLRIELGCTYGRINCTANRLLV